MPVDFQALWLHCGLGSVAFAAASAGGRRQVHLAGGAGFAVFTAWSVLLTPPRAEAVGLASALAVAALLVGPQRHRLAAVMAGGLAAIWGALLTSQGTPVGLAFGVATLLPASAWIGSARSPAFAPPEMREEALLLTGILGVCVAGLPGMLDGWRAAATLSAGVSGATAEPLPAWVVGTGALALASGGAYSLWRRR